MKELSDSSNTEEPEYSKNQRPDDKSESAFDRQTVTDLQIESRDELSGADPGPNGLEGEGAQSRGIIRL